MHANQRITIIVLMADIVCQITDQMRRDKPLDLIKVLIKNPDGDGGIVIHDLLQIDIVMLQ